MAVKPDYKQTEVGILPEDWELKELGSIIDFQGGSQPPLTTFIPVSKEGYIRLLQIRDYKTDKYETYIPINLARKFCNNDDIMIGRYGPPIFQILKGLEGAYNVALMKAIPSKQVTKEYAYHFLKQDSLFNFVEKLSQRSSGQTGVDLQQLRTYPIGLPTIPEQIAIATVLTDADTLIANLEKLIVKKSNIKQGIMQTLLQPKEGCDVKILGEVCKIRKGQLITDSTRINGNVPVIAGGKAPAYYHNKANRIGKTITISGSGASAGYVGLHNYPIFASDCSTIEEGEGYSLDFIFYLLQLRQDKIFKMQTGGAQPHIHPKDLYPIQIPVPFKEEQSRIATILSDMDAEIALLEMKLEKYKNIKLGMMQNLLTGKIRLV